MKFIFRKQFFILLALLCVVPALAQEKVRVACVGNSVTYGYLLPDRERNAYPSQLQRLLGDGYEVGNFGHSGATLLRRGHRPYDRLPEFRQALDFKADLVVIHLGLNDTDPRNWPNYADEFIPDYRALIDSFRTVNPKAKIWICRMTPIFHGHARFQSGTRDWHALIQQRIEQIAATSGVGLIDLYEPLHKRPDLFPDFLHPDAEGAGILARTVFSAITGNYGGLRLPATVGDGMVIQRERPFTLHGSADAGERISVKFRGKKYAATAAADGTWSVILPAMKAGGPYTLDVSTERKRIAVKDVWVGEVWLCSGQSNMEFRVDQSFSAQEDLAIADTLTRLHFYNMPSLCPTYAVEWDSTLLDTINRLHYIRSARWERCDAKSAARFSAIGYHFGRILADSLGCHVGLICNAVGGSPAEAWIDRTTLENELPNILSNWRQADYMQPWVRERASQNIRKAKNPLQRHPYEPAYLFESGILPLERYGVRGVLWYQGESNAHNVEFHERLFPMLEQSWRCHFGDDTLPFYFVQLSSIAPRHSWPHFRDSQRRMADKLPHTWMAVCSDLGDSLDVHPRHKRQVGERLAASALHNTYGFCHVTPCGPTYRDAVRKGGKLVLRFDHAKGLRPDKGERLIGFEVAGADGIYHPAEVRIKGETITLWSKAVKHPRAVRYGWQPFTHANLVNAAGLPASTFRDERIW